MRSVLVKVTCRAAVQETGFNLMNNSPGEPACLIYLGRWCFSVAACWFCGMRTVSTREKLALCMGFSGREVITLGTFPSIASPCIHGFVVRFELKKCILRELGTPGRRIVKSNVSEARMSVFTGLRLSARIVSPLSSFAGASNPLIESMTGAVNQFAGAQADWAAALSDQIVCGATV